MKPPPDWVPGRLRWDSRTPRTQDWGALAAAPPYDAIIVDDAPRDPVLLAALQQQLRPGGALVVLAAAQPRRTARSLRPFFEGGAPGPRGFTAVQSGSPIIAYRRGPGIGLAHFETIAPHYAGELPPHLVSHYLERKVGHIVHALAGTQPRLGLDIGCGVGLYARRVGEALGCDLVGLDAAVQALREAQRDGGGRFAAADVQHLPFPDGTFDFAYTINVIHHLKRGEQGVALAEMMRVLRPGAPLLVFEINIQNPLFRFYMRHVFPRTRAIDRGDEEFLRPRELAQAAPVPFEGLRYTTFIPDFAPKWSLGVLRRAERLLERVAGRYSIHYTAVLRKPGTIRPGGHHAVRPSRTQ